ncbi:MAG: fluoride efflux transporter CrcB [Clostridiales bacterium]|jgi:CrcB protein|nr:fluoride efflux transporter CrcB [Clostridiales bacterium]
MLKFLAVGIGGFVGSCGRYALNRLMKYLPFSFPLDTLLANVIAGFFIGFIMGMEQQSLRLSPNIKLFLTTGLLGGLSTFCTFSLQTVTYFQSGKYAFAIGNILLNLGLSLLGTVSGIILARTVFSKL